MKLICYEMVAHAALCIQISFTTAKRETRRRLAVSIYRKNAEILRWRRNSSSITVQLMNEQLVSLRVLCICIKAIYFERESSLVLCKQMHLYSYEQIFLLITERLSCMVYYNNTFDTT